MCMHMLMLVFFNPFASSIVMLPVIYLLAIRNMTASRKELMDSEFEKLRMLHLATPVVMSTTGVLTRACNLFYKCLASL